MQPTRLRASADGTRWPKTKMQSDMTTPIIYTWHYRARRASTGELIAGTVQADGKESVLRLIERRGEVVIAISLKPFPEPTQQQVAAVQTAGPVYPQWKRDQLAYRLFAFFLGFLGIHDFYAGRIKEGFALLLLTIVSVIVTPLIQIVVFILIVTEMITVDRDGWGVPMRRSQI